MPRPLDIAHGDVDTVLAGPTGIFAIEVKNWPGTIAWDRGQLRKDGRIVSDAVRQTTRGAIAVRERLGVRWVEGVLAVVNAEVRDGPIELETATVVSASGLKPYLLNRPPRFDRKQVAELARSLERIQRT